ncbi:MAG TPA: peptidyl-prolyl cis-trans isomerase [Vicinamibacterales bacterium]|jgi:peptidyl-prolyl cis-trans isomerase D|nr:peptidyl-prolyl cis-trans isomerase [Vicinamibacterales bacterium]
MTMLDRMRRHRSWLKWSLAIVVVSFVLLYIPSFLGNGPQQGAANNAVVAEVNGQEISAAEFRRVYQQQIQAYRQSYGANVDERLLKQLGIDQRIVQQMVEEQAALSEAKRLGITASDAEVRERILALPAFQENGQFIGDQRYRQVLQMQNPPMRTDEFEDEVRRSIMTEKLQAALTGWMTVSDSDVRNEFNRRNEKVKLAVVSFPADKFREGVVATDADVTKYFEGHQEEFRIPEKRKIRFLTIDQEALRQKVTVTGQQIERYYNDNIQQFSTPEQVHAEHILLKTDGKDDAAVKKEAESILAQARGGANFEDLAKKYSEDDASKAKGGDLDYFGRGQMVKEFDDAAFAAKPGDIVGPVKTQFGYHIIKVLDHRQAQTKPLAEVRSQIEDQLKFEQAQDQAQKAADSISSQLKSPADFDKVARDHGLTVHESGFFQQDEPIAGIGLAPNVAQEAFTMKIGDVSDPIRTPQGYAFITVLAKQDSYLPKLDEVKAKVRDAVLKEKAIDAARQKAASVDAAMKSGDFDKAAKDAGVEVKTTDFIARGSQVTDIGQSAAVDAAAFSLPKGGVSDPIVTANGAAIIKVVDKQMPSPSDFTAQKDSLRTELLNQRRNEFYSAYMNKARQRMDIRINREVIAQITA